MAPNMTVEDLLSSRGVPLRVSVEEARVAVAAALMNSSPSIERVALDNALGRVLAEDILSPHSLPPFANSAMDGYAFRHTDLAAASEPLLQCVGESRAGQRYNGRLAVGQCVRISTGAVMPADADTVVIQEDTQRSQDQVRLQQIPAAGANVRKAGEECAAGAQLLSRGRGLGARGLALAATAGRDELRVLARPRVAILTTGDELALPGQALGPGQIYDSNSALLHALVIDAGAYPLPATQATADDPQRLLHALRRAAAAADLVLTTGGASVGDHDHLPSLLAEHGSVHFWKVRMKPGMPALFGELAGKPVLALPGNPVSVFATFQVLVRAALSALQGLAPVDPLRWRARLLVPLRKTHKRAEFLRGIHNIDSQGQLWVRPLSGQESHRSVALLQASVLLCLPEAEIDLAAGALVDVEPLFARPESEVRL